MRRIQQISAIAERLALAALALFVFVSKPLAQESPIVPVPQQAEFHNPVLWEDLPDTDILRVGDAYYYSASTMHYSPGAPILRSFDLVNWEFVGHSVPVLDFSPAYDLNGSSAYVKGVWASFLGYRKSNKTFYWGGCIEQSKTYIYTAPAAEGPWQKKARLDHCYYDAGLLIDDDDTMYVAYGNTRLHVAQLSRDGTSEVRSEEVFASPANIGYIEGSRFYKLNGNYYIFTTKPPNAEYVLKSTTGPFGPYTVKPLVVRADAPIPGAGSPHQGGIVQTPGGDWYYMAFMDAYPGGRVPVLAPVTWDSDGWPRVKLEGNRWIASGTYPATPHPAKSLTGVDSFAAKGLGPEWEWNHNPDNSKWSLDGGLRLKTATITDDLYMARNTLTHRILGPQSTATIVLDYSRMKDGDRSGLALLRDSSAWIGIVRDGAVFKVAMHDDLAMDKQWHTTGKGTEEASAAVAGRKIWLRVSADIRPGPHRTGQFSYSEDGDSFRPLGPPFVLESSWQFFMGYRFAIFNYGSRSLGGEARVSSFSMTSP
jgi:beta-xylosidase